jgi:HK97 gp10 family phage protein
MSMTLTGDKELERRLKKLPANIQRNLARKSLRKALTIVRDEARQNAPVLGGKLKKAIKTRVSLKSDGRMTGKVFVQYNGKRGAPYAHLVEWGGPRNGSSRFMTRAFESKIGEVIGAFRDELKKNIALAGKL